jgi:hypothetical protein
MRVQACRVQLEHCLLIAGGLLIFVVALDFEDAACVAVIAPPVCVGPLQHPSLVSNPNLQSPVRVINSV